jgi:hypothetical protein
MRQIVQMVRAVNIQWGALAFRGDPPQWMMWPCDYEYRYVYDHEGD